MTSHLGHDREGQVVLNELARVLAANILVGNLRNLNDLQARSTHTVAGSHFLVERIHRRVHRRLAVLLIRVVVTRAGLVTDPDAEVLHGRRVRLKDLFVIVNESTLVSLSFRVFHRRDERLTRFASLKVAFASASRSRAFTHPQRRTSLHAMIWPFAFFTFLRRDMKYQNFDRALTSSSAHNFMRNTSGSGCASVGTCRPTTWYWWYCVEQSFARFLVSRSFVERFDRAHREHEIIFPRTRRRARDVRARVPPRARRPIVPSSPVGFRRDRSVRRFRVSRRARRAARAARRARASSFSHLALSTARATHPNFRHRSRRVE